MMALRRLASRAVKMPTGRAASAYALPDLSYDHGALQPAISGEIMELHHKKHHQAYVTNFNVALEKYAAAEAKGDIQTMIALQGVLKFNGGGHAPRCFCHSPRCSLTCGMRTIPSFGRTYARRRNSCRRRVRFWLPSRRTLGRWRQCRPSFPLLQSACRVPVGAGSGMIWLLTSSSSVRQLTRTPAPPSG